MNKNKILVSKLFDREVLSPVTFTAICANNSQKACIIDYPPPSQTGFHLIRYTNCGCILIIGNDFFLAEVIHVEKEKTFKYSKTSEGEIKSYREYSDDSIDIKIKIIDDRKANHAIIKSDSGSQNANIISFLALEISWIKPFSICKIIQKLLIMSI